MGSSPTNSEQSLSRTSSRASSPSLELICQYEQLMSSILPVSTSHQANPADNFSDEDTSSVKPLSKGEKQNAKKKRRKERERSAREIELAGSAAQPSDQWNFRLFSSTSIQSVSLLPRAEEYPLPPNPRLAPRSQRDLDLLHSRSVEAAVTYPDLGGPFYSYCQSRSNRMFEVKLDDSSSRPDLPSIFLSIVSQPRSPPGMINDHRPKVSVETVRLSKLVKGVGRGHRRRRTASSGYRPSPRYWRPPPDLGGKSGGYALGYG